MNQVFQQPGMVPQPQKTNGLAIAALVLSLVGCSLLGVIFGGIAISQINKGQGSGKGLAIAGLVIGIIGLLLAMVFWGSLMAAIGGSDF